MSGGGKKPVFEKKHPIFTCFGDYYLIYWLLCRNYYSRLVPVSEIYRLLEEEKTISEVVL